MEIIVDSRESSIIVDNLTKLGVEVRSQLLNVGDYIIGNDYIVERKTKSDFDQSIYDNRLFEQTHRMISEYDHVTLIYENDGTKDAISKNLAGAFAYLTIHKGIPIIPSPGPSSTAVILERMASWVQDEHTDPILNRGGPKRLTKRDQQLYLLQGLIGVGLKTASLLLDRFKEPQTVFEMIKSTTFTYTKNGKPKSIIGPLADLKGIGIKFVQRNQELLSESKSVDSIKH